MWIVLLALLLLGAQVPLAAELQYLSATKVVTGFRLGPIQAVADHSVATVPDTFLQTIPQPAGCSFSLQDYAHLLTVTDETPGSIAVQFTQAPVCFQGQPVFSKQEVSQAAGEILGRLFGTPELLYTYTVRRCPNTDTTPHCVALRQVVYGTDPPLSTLGVIAQEAIQVQGSLP